MIGHDITDLRWTERAASDFIPKDHNTLKVSLYAENTFAHTVLCSTHASELNEKEIGQQLHNIDCFLFSNEESKSVARAEGSL